MEINNMSDTTIKIEGQGMFRKDWVPVDINYMDIPIVELESMPRDELRSINMDAVQQRFARLLEDRPITLTSEILPDMNTLRVTVSVPKVRFIDYMTGKIVN